MSWRYPKGHTRPGESIAIDGLNDGFLPVVEEFQGRINEQNFKDGAITETNFPIPFSSDGYVPDTFVEPDVWEWVKTVGPFPPLGSALDASPTRGACLTPGYDGINNQLEWVRFASGDGIAFMSLEGWIGAWTPANTGMWSTIGIDTIDTAVYPNISQSPMVYETTLDEGSTIWVMCSLQAASVDFGGKGMQFSVFINGVLISESIWGSGDPTNTPVGSRSTTTSASSVGPSSSFFNGRGAGTFTCFTGFPACV